MGHGTVGRFGLTVVVALVTLASLGAWASPALAASPPTVTKSFGASSIALNGTTSMSIAITNPNASTLNDITFTDNLPFGLVVGNPNGLSRTCSTGGQSGAVTATPGSSTVSLSGTSPNPLMTAHSDCTISVNVTGIWAGAKDNSVTVNSANGASAPAAASLTVLPPPAADRIYWSSTSHGISYVNLDGTGRGGDLPTGAATVDRAYGVALDPSAGRIYWTNRNGNKISYANLDGTGGGDLTITGAATVASPTGLAIDHAAGRIYWANFGNNTISSANLSGSGSANLTTTPATVNQPGGIALDVAVGRVYWANTQPSGIISYANLNNSGGVDLSTGGGFLDFPVGVALDPIVGRIYWANGGNSTISSANLGGGGGANLTTSPATPVAPTGVAIDPSVGQIYWTNSNSTGGISRANLNGTGGSDLTTISSTFNGLVALLRAPIGEGAPTITGGSTAGSVLTCSPGTWAPDLLGSQLYRAPTSFAYQWRLNGADIGGATSSTYTATSAGSYSCGVTASNAAGSAQQTSGAFSVQPVPAGGTPTGQRAPALKKCKKNYKKNHKKKKFKKCKKKANLLPV